MKSQFPIKVWGPERTSWTGQEDGRKKNENTIFKGPKFAAQKHLFLDIFENFQNRRFWSANFSMKTAPREKTEYTTTKGTENASIQIKAN